MATPLREFEIDESLVRRLLASQEEELSGEDVVFLDEGWDNVLFRLGKSLLLRIPRREMAVEMIIKEQEWLPRIGPLLPIAVPVPHFFGEPTDEFPWPWSVVPFCAGQSANLNSIELAGEAERLAGFLRALHSCRAEGAPRSSARGVPLALRSRKTGAILNRLSKRPETVEWISPRILKIWDQALSTEASRETRLLHGDLHARNVIVDENGRIVSVIDWGDLCAGDAATDLMGVWSLFPSRELREVALGVYGADDDLVFRAKGWAISFAAMLIDSAIDDHAEHLRMGCQILQRIAADNR